MGYAGSVEEGDVSHVSIQLTYVSGSGRMVSVICCQNAQSLPTTLLDEWNHVHQIAQLSLLWAVPSHFSSYINTSPKVSAYIL